MKKLVIVAILAISVIACKTEQKENVDSQVDSEKIIEVKKELIVNFNFKTNREDEFILKLNSVVVDEFQKKNIHVIEKVAPSSSMENINAKFGENNISNSFYISFGNKELKEVEIESIELSYGSNSVKIGASELSEYFALNKYVSQDSTSFKLQTKRVDNQHYPQIVLKRKVINNLLSE